MTCLIASLDRDAGYLSQDSLWLLRSRDGLPSRIILSLLSWVDGLGPSLARLGHGDQLRRKVHAFPRQRMVLGCAGDYMTTVRVASHGHRFENVDQFASALPELWQSLPMTRRHQTAHMMLLGYLPSASRVVGYIATTQSGFQIEPMEDGATRYSPMPPDECDDLAIDRLVQEAVSQRDIENIHRFIGVSVAEASRRGYYGPHRRIGGPLHFARVTADGVETRSIGDLG